MEDRLESFDQRPDLRFVLQVKFKKDILSVEMEPNDTVEQLRYRLFEQTSILPKRMKLMGAKGTLTDEMTMAEARLDSKSKLQLLGTPEDRIFVFDGTQAETLADEVETGDDAMVPQAEMEVHLQKIAQRVATVEVEEISPALHHRLLVLDVDYTLYDHRSAVENVQQLARPFLHDFLERANKSYDLVIWSATGYKWVWLKMKELGVLSSPRYKIRFLLCERPMITVETQLRDRMGVCRCKPLKFIWDRFPTYTPEHTIMFDDVRHNFVMNPRNGLRIRPFRNAPLNQEKDTELLRLAEFLDMVKDMDITTLDLKKWELFLK